jgi:hypothetical protein
MNNIYKIKSEFPSDEFFFRAESIEQAVEKFARLRNYDVVTRRFTGVYILRNTVIDESLSIYVMRVVVLD